MKKQVETLEKEKKELHDRLAAQFKKVLQNEVFKKNCSC